jgi:hypothetical protein
VTETGTSPGAAALAAHNPHGVTEQRIERLSAASLRRVIEPDVEVRGQVGPGMLLPRELLSLAGLDLELSDEQWVKLSREELASVLDAGVRFESVLMAGFGLMMAYDDELTDPRVVYTLHEIGEETRHSRIFIRVLEQLQPTAVNPFQRGISRLLDRFVTTRLIQRKALFCVMVLAGEEGPDLLQKLWSEHPDTDPFVRRVNLYHRAEESRHLSFARTILPELWREAPWLERVAVRRIAPTLVAGLFDTLVQPGVYRSIGLPGWRTWNAVRASTSHQRLRAEAVRPVCEALRQAGAFGQRGRLPPSWRRLCEFPAASPG